MLRADGDPELRVFDPVIRSLHWLTLFLVITIFALAFSIEFASSRGEAVGLIQQRPELDFAAIDPRPAPLA